MIKSGLVSVTFRNKSVRDICGMCVRAGIEVIEWGGDIHVPRGAHNARETLKLTRESGMKVFSYGSYYRVGEPREAFLEWLNVASELEAPLIRVWLGSRGSLDCSGDERERLVDGLADCCYSAKEKGIIVAPEFHGGTLTDSLSSVISLMDETKDIDNLKFYWQPRWDWDIETNLAALKAIGDRLAGMHVFAWRHNNGTITRLPLIEGAPLLQMALECAPDVAALIEFVKDDSGEAFYSDTISLHSIIKKRPQ